MKTTKELIKESLQNKKISEENIDVLVDSINSDLEKRFPETSLTENLSFGKEIPEEIKLFGQSTASLIPDEKLMVFEVVNDESIYLDVDGEEQVFAFPEVAMEELAGNLEGVPVVIGEGHDADLALAYFTGKSEIKDIDGRKALMAEAKLRSDKNAPFDFESFMKNPSLDVNGGSERIGGSLAFFSKDVPVEFDNGVKVNYMTGASPRHYALLNSPVFETAGLKAKNFGEDQEEQKGEHMVKETNEVPEVDVTKEVNEALDARLESLELPALEDENVRKAVMSVIVDLATPKDEMVSKAEYDATVAKLQEKETELATIERDALVDKIRTKELGDEPSEEATAAFDEKVKEFGMDELTGYNSALDVAKEQIKQAEEAAASRKDFGKSRAALDGNRKKERKISFGPSAGKTA